MRFRVGYQIQPQHCTVQQIREAYRAADSLRVDTLWVWDHMFPLYGPADGNHFACMPLLAGDRGRDAARAVRLARAREQLPEPRAPGLRRRHHGPPERRAAPSSASAPAGSSATTRSTGSSSGPRASRLRDLGAALPRIKSRLGEARAAADRQRADHDRGRRREGDAQAHRAARRHVEHVPARRQLAAQERDPDRVVREGRARPEGRRAHLLDQPGSLRADRRSAPAPASSTSSCAGPSRST